MQNITKNTQDVRNLYRGPLLKHETAFLKAIKSGD